MGVVMIIQYFVPALDLLYDTIRYWLLVVAGFVLCLGIYSLVRVHIIKIRRKASGWGYSYVTIAGLTWMTLIGFISGKEEGTLFMNTFFLIQVPIQSTMFALLAFFIASAAFRAFRMKNLEAGLLLLAAIIVMIGQVPAGVYLFDKLLLPFLINIVNFFLLILNFIVLLFVRDFGIYGIDPYSLSIADFKEWILNVPNLAAKRGIVIGVALGMLSTALKIILGIERSYLSGGGK